MNVHFFNGFTIPYDSLRLNANILGQHLLAQFPTKESQNGLPCFSVFLHQCTIYIIYHWL